MFPAPEIAWSVVSITVLSLNWRSGASAMHRTTVEQFGLVMIRPFHPRVSCFPRSERWSALTSGMSSGTASSIR